MKKSVFMMYVWILIGLLVSCNPNNPSQKKDVTLKNVMDVVMEYYPYIEGDVLTFRNETSDDILTITAKSKNNIPFLFQDTITGSLMDGNRGWHLSVEAYLSVNYQDSKDYSCTTRTIMDFKEEENTAEIMWLGDISLNSNEEFQFSTDFIKCTKDELYSNLTEIIRIPMSYHVYSHKALDPIENAYMEIARGIGINAFCLDGTTIWKRVQ